MKLFEYKPKKHFEGMITIKVPQYKERIKLLKECNFKLGKEGDLESGEGQFDSIEKMIEVTEKHIEKVALVHGGEEINSVEDLGYYAEGTELLNEVGGLILNGFTLGKSSEKS